MQPDDPRPLPPGARHGTNTAYCEHRCRCRPCRDAVAKHQNLYLLRRQQVGGQRLTTSTTGSIRRLRALMRLGWTRRDLSVRLGYTEGYLSPLLGGRRERVTLDTHQRIAELYDALCMTPGPSQRTRNIAEKRGWAPPLAWDDIDTDPEPQGMRNAPTRADHIDETNVLRRMAGDRIPLTKAEAVELVRRWRASGRSLNECKRVTGLRPDRYIDKDAA